jgi:hypothetical protein
MTSCGRFAVAAAVTLAACGPPRVPVSPIINDDFTLSGVPLDMDSAEFRVTFGDPDSIVSIPNPADASVPIIEWYFDGFRVQFIDAPTPNGFLITERTEATARGVRVGDPAFVVTRLYGDPTGGDESAWRYNDPGDPTGAHVVDFLVESDTVRRIYIGWLVQ